MRIRTAVLCAVLPCLACSDDNHGQVGTDAGVDGALPRQSPPPPPLAFRDQARVLGDNGPAPQLDAASVCGSSTETYLAELRNTLPSRAKVQQEWADVAPGGKQVAISGLVSTTHLGPFDLPMSHQLGDDLSMNIALDAPFLPYTQHLGPEPGEQGEDRMHVEISAGLIPHVESAPAPEQGQTWADMTEKNRTAFQPGFDLPSVGDRALVQGRYIVDCGHPDYSTELHPISFLAFAHVDRDVTTVRAYYNGYRDSERYTPSFDVLGKTGDAARFDRPDTKTFPPWLSSEIGDLVTGKISRLRSYELMDSERAQAPAFEVCAPATASGQKLSYGYDIVTRKGVSVRASADEARGCVTFEPEIKPDYQPADLKLRHCVLGWDYLNEVARQAEEDPNLDVRQQVIDVAGRITGNALEDVDIACGDALSGPTVDVNPSERRTREDNDQPFPFYGVITVGWE